MLIPDQLIEVKWNPTTRQHYENLGYTFTHYKDEFQVRVEDLMVGSGEKVLVKCDRCGSEYEIPYGRYNNIIKKRGGEFFCQKCSGKITQENKATSFAKDRINDLKYFCETNGFTPISTIKDYQNAHSKLYYICPKHGMQYTTGDQLQRGVSGCNGCGYDRMVEKKKLSQNEVLQIIEGKNGNIWLNYGDYVSNAKNNLEIKCGKCGDSYITCLMSYKNSLGVCPSCAYKPVWDSKRLTTDELINRIDANELLNPEDYISRPISNLKIKCCECGSIYTTSLATYENHHNIRCPSCSNKMSKMEREVAEYLDFCNISYEYEKVFEDCKDITYLPFDFYLPDYNTIIETDGQQHYEPVFGEESFKRTILHDGMKNNYCRWNNIDLLRIPYWDKDAIERIISKYLGINYGKFFQQIEYIPTAVRKQMKEQNEVA